MSRETTVPQSIPYAPESNDLANNGDFDIDPSNAPGNGPTLLEVNQIVFGGSCDVKYLVDVDDDGTYEINETIDSFSSSDAPGISMGNTILLFEGAGQVLRVTNTSGGSADYSVVGRVVGGVTR